MQGFGTQLDALAQFGIQMGEQATRRGHIYCRSAQQELVATGADMNTQVLLYPVTDIREEVIASYTYTVVLNRSAVFIGLLSGFFVALTLELVLGIFRLFVHIMKIKLKSAQRKATSGN